MLALADWANDDGYCWPSIPKIASRARRSDRQAQRVLHRLEAEGEIYIHEGGGQGQSSRYLMLTGFSVAEVAKSLQHYFKVPSTEAKRIAAERIARQATAGTLPPGPDNEPDNNGSDGDVTGDTGDTDEPSAEAEIANGDTAMSTNGDIAVSTNGDIAVSANGDIAVSPDPSIDPSTDPSDEPSREGANAPPSPVVSESPFTRKLDLASEPARPAPKPKPRNPRTARDFEPDDPRRHPAVVAYVQTLHAGVGWPDRDVARQIADQVADLDKWQEVLGVWKMHEDWSRFGVDNMLDRYQSLCRAAANTQPCEPPAPARYAAYNDPEPELPSVSTDSQEKLWKRIMATLGSTLTRSQVILFAGTKLLAVIANQARVQVPSELQADLFKNRYERILLDAFEEVGVNITELVFVLPATAQRPAKAAPARTQPGARAAAGHAARAGRVAP
jgi:hypothetical protein